jgi:hypothetical protein
MKQESVAYFRPQKTNLGRAASQAVNLWLPAAAVRVRARVKSRGICGGHSSIGAGFLSVLRFPLPLTNFSTIITIYHPGLVQ